MTSTIRFAIVFPKAELPTRDNLFVVRYDQFNSCLTALYMVVDVPDPASLTDDD